MYWLKALMILLVLHHSSQAKVPRFQDYPVATTWRGKQAKLWLRTYNEKLFLTQLTTAAKEPPDFAGHYKIAGWGCGSVCASGALIDLKTGTIRPLPFGGQGRGAAYWIFTGGPMEEKYIEYRRDSRLLIIRRITSGKETTWETLTYYFIWDGNRFKQIK
jgi:hypothetical protein